MAGRRVPVITGGAVSLAAARWADVEARAGASFGVFTSAHPPPTDRAPRLPRVGEAVGAGARARRRHLTGPIGRPTHRASCLEAVSRAGGMHTITGLGRVTGCYRRATDPVRRL